MLRFTPLGMLEEYLYNYCLVLIRKWKRCSLNWRKVDIVYKPFLTLYEKDEFLNICLFFFIIPSFVSFKICINVCSTKSNLKHKIFSRVNQKKIKRFIKRLVTKLQIIIAIRDILSSSVKPKNVPFIPWQNKLSNLKTTCHIKSNFF